MQRYSAATGGSHPSRAMIAVAAHCATLEHEYAVILRVALSECGKRVIGRGVPRQVKHEVVFLVMTAQPNLEPQLVRPGMNPVYDHCPGATCAVYDSTLQCGDKRLNAASVSVRNSIDDLHK